MVQTPGECDLCSSLKENHPRLVPVMEDLCELLAEANPARRHVEMAVTAVFEVMTQQFDREQRGHLFQHVAELDPGLAECAECRHAEHMRLLEQMEQIRAAFDRRRSQTSEEVDHYLRFLVEGFLVAWKEHERKEDQLVQDAIQAEVPQSR